MKVNSERAAWEAAKEMVGAVERDEMKSSRAGYPVYTAVGGGAAYVCDLNGRLEVNLENGRSVQIWIEETENDEVQNSRIYEVKTTRGEWLKYVLACHYAAIECEAESKKSAESPAWRRMNAEAAQTWRERGDNLKREIERLDEVERAKRY